MCSLCEDTGMHIGTGVYERSLMCKGDPGLCVNVSFCMHVSMYVYMFTVCEGFPPYGRNQDFSPNQLPFWLISQLSGKSHVFIPSDGTDESPPSSSL